jgi:hypothetical protein
MTNETDEHGTCPLPYGQAVDAYFMEHRAKLIDIAAFLDRVERAADRPDTDDFRVAAIKEAIALLIDGKPQRAKRVLDILSDHSMEPLQSAAGLKGAYGAHPK